MKTTAFGIVLTGMLAIVSARPDGLLSDVLTNNNNYCPNNAVNTCITAGGRAVFDTLCQPSLTTSLINSTWCNMDCQCQHGANGGSCGLAPCPGTQDMKNACVCDYGTTNTYSAPSLDCSSAVPQTLRLILGCEQGLPSESVTCNNDCACFHGTVGGSCQNYNGRYVCLCSN